MCDTARLGSARSSRSGALLSLHLSADRDRGSTDWPQDPQDLPDSTGESRGIGAVHCMLEWYVIVLYSHRIVPMRSHSAECMLPGRWL